MASLERWRIVKHFTIYQIALLMTERDPADFEDLLFQDWSKETRHEVLPIISALRHSIEDERLPLHKEVYGESYGDGIDFYSSLVDVGQLRIWLSMAGVAGGFFHVPAPRDRVEDKYSSFYAAKLSAANAAWKAVTSDPASLRGKSPKKALELWLREHAAEFGLVNKDGTPNATGIEEIAKVANWKPSGGAPTPPKVETQHEGGFGQARPTVPSNHPRGYGGIDLDDEIPF